MLKLFGNRFYFKSTDAGSSSLTKGCHKRAGIFRQLSLTLILIVAGAATASAATFHVQSTEDNSLCGLFDPLTLKCAINQAEANGAIPDVIVLQNGATYTVSTPQSAETGFQIIKTPIHIIGNGAVIRRASTPYAFRFFQVDPTGDLTLENLTLRGGNVLSFGNGGAILNYGKLRVLNSILENNASNNGGAIANSNANSADPTVVIDRSSIRNNIGGGSGGGLWSEGGQGLQPSVTLTIKNSSFTGNNRSGGGGQNGGGLYVAYAHNLMLVDTTISYNASSLGGGIMLFALPERSANGTLLTTFLRNVTVAWNDAAQFGGIYYKICETVNCIPATVTITNSIVALNFIIAGIARDIYAESHLVSGGNNMVGSTRFC